MIETSTSDELYTKELTRRIVARAALHLGIQDMNLETLTVLQDALTQYLERICYVLGTNVEHSGRSSMHVNILDTIRAIEDCIPEGHLVELERFISDDMGGSNEGWNAPLDNYDSLDDYPSQSHFKDIDSSKVLTNLANKSAFASNDGSDQTTTAPTSIKQNMWAPSTLKTTSEDLLSLKRKIEVGEVESDKSKKSSPTQSSEASSEVKSHPDADYVPNFLPRFPPTQTFTQSVSITNGNTIFHAETIRSSLVEMGNYWGSINSNDYGSKSKIEIKVESGTKSVISADGVHDREVRRVDDFVKPIARASTARVAKILEGSMGTRT